MASTATTVDCSAIDHAGNEAEGSFTVSVQNSLGPARVAGFVSQAANRLVTLSWRQPSDWDYDHVTVSRSEDGDTWTPVTETVAGTSFADRSVRNDRIYQYRIVAVDTAGNTSGASELTARPSAFYRPAYLARLRPPVVLRWTPVARASYYNLQVWRNGRKVLSVWPSAAGYRLGSSWIFRGRRRYLVRGTYVVYAWPGFGSKAAARYGPLVGWTKFVR